MVEGRNLSLFDAAVLLDPDFDDFDGDLTLGQICKPQADLYVSRKGAGDPGAWNERNSEDRKKLREAERERLRLYREAERAKELKYAAVGARRERRDYKCQRCIPYNGHHTPDYWGTGQKDPW